MGDVQIGRVQMYAAALAAVMSAAAWAALTHPFTVDFTVFHDAARRADVYEPSALFVYPPPALPFLKPLRVLPFVPGFILWTVLSGLLFWLAARRLAGPIVATFSLLSGASLHGLLLGQTSLFVGAGILLACSVPSVASGALLGALATIKPQLLVAAPIILLVRRDWRAVGGFAAAFAAMILLSLLFYGVDAWRDWLAAFPAFQQALRRLDILPYVMTPAAVSESLGFDPLPWQVGGAALSLALIARTARRVETFNLAALNVIGSVLMVPYAVPHDLAAAMPAVTVYILSVTNLGVLLAMCLYVCFILPYAIAATAAWLTLWPAKYFDRCRRKVASSVRELDGVNHAG